MTTDQAIRLVYRDLDGQLTAAERVVLRTWEQADPANRRAADDTRRAWQAARPAADLPFKLDIAGDFERVRARTTARPAKVVPLRRSRSWLRIAAAIAFLAVSALALRLAFSSEPAWQTVANSSGSEVVDITLPDGSQVWLKGGSELAYPPTFDGATRSVRLVGEAFFEVAKDAAHPFIVETDALEVTVLGTAFNVRPPSDDHPAVTVREGKVRVAAEAFDETIIVTAGESVHLSADNQLLQKRADADGNATAWQRGYLRFTDTKLDAVLTDLSAHYATPIRADKALLNCTLTGRYASYTQLQDLLNMVAKAYGARVVREDGGRFVLKGGRCQ